MRNASSAILKIAIIIAVLEMVGFWWFFSWIHSTHIGALQATIQSKEGSIEMLKNSLGAQQQNSTVGGAQPSPSLGKYVCTTSLPLGQGKHALLVEFGLRRGQTNGFFGRVDFATSYGKAEGWMGAPLRTNREPVPSLMANSKIIEDPARLSYMQRFMSPVITPHLSYYLYFEAAYPLQIKDVLFLEDHLALSDQVRAGTLAKQFDTCPR